MTTSPVANTRNSAEMMNADIGFLIGSHQFESSNDNQVFRSGRPKRCSLEEELQINDEEFNDNN